jgi:hypothetical protein
MRTHMKLTVPDSVEATMTLTMTIKEWREFSKQLTDEWPSTRVADAIGSTIDQAEKAVWAHVE